MGLLEPGAVILVTGAIGQEVAAQAAMDGAIVAVHGSREESVRAAMDTLKARVPSARLVPAPADFQEAGAIERMVEQVVGITGRLDAVIHCGVTGAPGVTGLFAKIDAAGLAAHSALVLATFQRLCLAALPHLARQGGTIVGFASDAGRFAAPRQSVVGAAFGGLIAFVRNLAVEVARDGVRVHCIAPGFVAGTPSYERHADRADAAAKRAGLGLPTPADIAPTALFLCGPLSARTTGQIISINGGMSA